VSIYSDMLKMALDGDREDRARSIALLVSDALRCRAQLTGPGPGDPAGRPSHVAARVADCLAYDAALVRLWDRLALEQDLTGDGDTRTARWRAEARLAQRLPGLAPALLASEQADVGGWR
jgi:hypothetical protein